MGSLYCNLFIRFAGIVKTYSFALTEEFLSDFGAALMSYVFMVLSYYALIEG
jgi:hypothetical protein